MSRRPQLRGQAGITMAPAILSLALMITLGGLALNQAVQALRASTAQTSSKRALQAADAALDAATYAASFASIGGTLSIDPVNPTSVITQNCVASVGQVSGIELANQDLDLSPLDPLTQQDPNGRKWCPTSGIEKIQGGEFEFRLSQLIRAGAGPCGTSHAIQLDRDVVGVGRASGKVRRVKAHLQANVALLSGAAVQSSSTSPLAMSGTAKILGDAQSNGNITGTAVNTISGNATPGHNYSASGPTSPTVVGTRTPACEDFLIPDVDQGTAPTVNNNAGITETCVSTITMLQQASCVLPIVGRTGSVTLAANRVLTIDGNGRAPLTGSVYSFCKIIVKGDGVLQVMSSSAQTRIFLDDPANCSGVSNPGTISVTERGRIVNCHLQTAPETLQLYAVGSTTTNTTQTFAGTSLPTTALRGTLCGLSLGGILGEPMTIVAPRSQVDLAGGTAISGQVAAYRVTMANSASVNPISALVNLNRLGSRPVLPLFKAVDYIECTGQDFSQLPAAAPAQGC